MNGRFKSFFLSRMLGREYAVVQGLNQPKLAYDPRIFIIIFLSAFLSVRLYIIITRCFYYGLLHCRPWKIMYTGLEGLVEQDQLAGQLHFTQIEIWLTSLRCFSYIWWSLLSVHYLFIMPVLLLQYLVAQIKKAMADVQSGNTVTYATGKAWFFSSLFVHTNKLQYMFSCVLSPWIPFSLLDFSKRLQYEWSIFGSLYIVSRVVKLFRSFLFPDG